jgi:hypothetical protein
MEVCNLGLHAQAYEKLLWGEQRWIDWTWADEWVCPGSSRDFASQDEASSQYPYDLEHANGHGEPARLVGHNTARFPP